MTRRRDVQCAAFTAPRSPRVLMHRRARRAERAAARDARAADTPALRTALTRPAAFATPGMARAHDAFATGGAQRVVPRLAPVAERPTVFTDRAIVMSHEHRVPPPPTCRQRARRGTWSVNVTTAGPRELRRPDAISRLLQMTAPALLMEATPPPDEIDPVLVERVRDTFGAGWLAIREQLRREPPSEDSEAEFEAIGTMGHLVVSLMERVAPAIVGRLLGTAFSHGMEAAWRSEYDETSVDRKLGMKLTGEALRVLLELLATKLSRVQLPADLPEDAARSVMEQVAHWPKPLRSLYRLEIYCFVAFDLAREADTDEFCAWARRAASAARRADADWRDLSIENLVNAAHGDDGLIVIPPDRSAAVLEAIERPAEPNDALIALFRGE